jgi:hypothetical protein
MPTTKEQVAACHRLYRLGAFKQFGAGDVIARGFADVGFEEFFILYDGTLLSLTSGDRSNLSDGEKQAFFLIPSIDDILDEIAYFGGIIEQIQKLPAPLGWRIEISSVVVGMGSVEAISLFDGILRALGFLLGINPFESSQNKLILTP